MHYMCVVKPRGGTQLKYRAGHSRSGRNFFQFDNVGGISPWRANPAPLGATVLVMDKGDGRVEIASKVPLKLRRVGARMVISVPDQVLGMVLTPPAAGGEQCDAHTHLEEDAPEDNGKRGWLARLRDPQWRQKWKSNLEEFAGGVMFCACLLGLMFLASML